MNQIGLENIWQHEKIAEYAMDKLSEVKNSYPRIMILTIEVE